MPKYREHFTLDPHDIDRIERAIRVEIAQHAELVHPEDPSALRSNDEIRALNQLLAKIFHQKVFFSQVNRTGVPGG
jgi:hypothetical protein